jgi:8-oxo-dGTP pyrophosphatase MutT (NUDIX family)
VKGTIEFAETMHRAAERELLEESGVCGVATDWLGTVQMSEPDEEWHFVVCRTGVLPELWTHRTSDGGGLDFAFFWHPLARAPGEDWHPHFRQALAFIGQRIKP